MALRSGRVFWYIMAFLSISVVGYTFFVLLFPSMRPAFVANLFNSIPVTTYFHLIGGAFALLCGTLQVNSTIRRYHLNWHRMIGRIYLISVIVGGIAGFKMALVSFGGLITHVGFGLMALAWLVTTILAFIRIRNGNVPSHQNWMIRSFSITLSAVTLRIYLPLSQVLGFEFEPAYQVISWLAWVPNLIFAEWYLRKKL